MASAVRGNGLEELKPVPVRVVAVEAAHSGQFAVEVHRVPRVPEPARPGIKPGHQQPRMRFARGPEILLNAEVEFYAMAAEPAPAARRQAGWFVELVEPEHAAVEFAQCWLGARRAGQLHVVDHRAPPFSLS